MIHKFKVTLTQKHRHSHVIVVYARDETDAYIHALNHPDTRVYFGTEMPTFRKCEQID